MCGGLERRILGRRLNTHQGLRPRRRPGIATTVVRCCGCGLIYSDPRPVPESLARHYEKPPEEYWRDSQLASNDTREGVPIDTFRRLWDSTSVPRALDIGAGLGQAMNRLSAAGFDTWGLEPSASFRDRAIERGTPANRILLAAVEDVDYERGSFDLISFGAVLEHLQDPSEAIARALGWLATDGLLFAEVPSARWLMGRLLNLSYRTRGLDYVTNLSPMYDPYHLYEFTLEAFKRHGDRVGYQVAYSRVLPCETFLPRLLEPFAQRVMAATETGMQLEVWLRRRSYPGS
jgi:SAM-dependent methyltransferase